jgi:hypothetical protein
METERTGLEKLKERRKNDPILDFEGQEYQFADPPKREALSESNKLEILNMSYSNRYFLFYNRMLEKMLIYEFVCINSDFRFKLRHEVNCADSFLFKHMASPGVGVDPVAYFRANLSQIKIDDEGCVKLCYVENLPIANVKDIDSNDPENEISVVQCRLIGAVFTVVPG